MKVLLPVPNTRPESRDAECLLLPGWDPLCAAYGTRILCDDYLADRRCLLGLCLAVRRPAAR